jgi:hypothetical protein
MTIWLTLSAIGFLIIAFCLILPAFPKLYSAMKQLNSQSPVLSPVLNAAAIATAGASLTALAYALAASAN